MSDKARLGFIGCGNIIRAHLAQGLKNFDDVEFVGWCDLKPEAAAARRDEVATARGVPAESQGVIFVDPAVMLDTVKPDAVYIALPTFAHGPVEAVVVERGLPFFIEKPVAIDLDTANRVLDGVRKRGLITSVGYHNRYRASVRRVKELLVGRQPVFMIGGWANAGPKPDAPVYSWWIQKHLSGGQFTEQATHTVDLARLLFGEVESVFATAVRDRLDRPEGYSIEDGVMAQVRFVNGAVACLYSSCCVQVGASITLSVQCVDMKAAFTSGKQDVTIEVAGQAPVTLSEIAEPLGIEDRAFVDSVKAGKDLGIQSTYEDGVKTLAVSLAADESMRTGRAVSLLDGGLRLG
jgi:predicted dehydrogenase